MHVLQWNTSTKNTDPDQAVTHVLPRIDPNGMLAPAVIWAHNPMSNPLRLEGARQAKHQFIPRQSLMGHNEEPGSAVLNRSCRCDVLLSNIWFHRNTLWEYRNATSRWETLQQKVCAHVCTYLFWQLPKELRVCIINYRPHTYTLIHTLVVLVLQWLVQFNYANVTVPGDVCVRQIALYLMIIWFHLEALRGIVFKENKTAAHVLCVPVNLFKVRALKLGYSHT